MKSFFFCYFWAEGGFKSKMGFELVVERSKIVKCPCVWSFCVRVAKNYLESIFLFCICRPTIHSCVCCFIFHLWSSPSPLKFGCGDWRCWAVVLIIFWLDLTFYQELSFGLGLFVSFLKQKSVMETGKITYLSLVLQKQKLFNPWVRFCKACYTMSSHYTKPFHSENQDTFALKVHVLT